MKLINYLLLLVTLSSCSAAFHVNQAEKHLTKAKLKDPSVEHVHTDTIRELVVIEPEEAEFEINIDSLIELTNKEPKYDTIIKDSVVYLKPRPVIIHKIPEIVSENGIKLEATLEGGKLKIKVLTPPDTIIVEHTTTVTVYKTVATYKEFIKHWWGVSNFQFFLIHIVSGVLVAAGIILYVYLKIILPRFPNLKI